MKYGFILSTLTASAIMAFSACSSDDSISSQNGTNANVTFNLSAPHLTRAYGDGSTATYLRYGVYLVEGEGNNKTYTLIPELSKTSLTTVDNVAQYVELNNLKAQISLPLSRGNSYAVVFWADAGLGTDEGSTNEVTPYAVDFTTDNSHKPTIGYKTDNDGNVAINNNDENNDAFYYKTEFVVSGNSTENVELKRPFAQINVATSTADWAASVASKFEPTATSFTLSDMPTSMYLLTGETDEAAANLKSITYKLATLPTEELSIQTNNNEAATIYKYLSLSYVLAPSAHATTTATISYGTGDAPYKVNASNNSEFANIPYQRNYRTNIYGDLLTSSKKFNVQIVPDFIEPSFNINVNSQEEFEQALQQVSTSTEASAKIITLNGNATYTVTSSLPNGVTIQGKDGETQNQLIVSEIPSDVTVKNVTLVRNEATTSTRSAEQEKSNSIAVINGTNIVLDNVKFGNISQKHDQALFVAKGASVTIKNTVFNQRYFKAIYAEGNAEVNLDNCTFQNCAYSYNGVGKLTAKNCSFYGWLSGWHYGATFESCNFYAGTRYYPGAICYGNTVFKSCTFEYNNLSMVNADGTEQTQQPDAATPYKYNYFVSVGTEGITITFDNDCKFTNNNPLFNAENRNESIVILGEGDGKKNPGKVIIGGTTYVSSDFVRAK